MHVHVIGVIPSYFLFPFKTCYTSCISNIIMQKYVISLMKRSVNSSNTSKASLLLIIDYGATFVWSTAKQTTDDRYDNVMRLRSMLLTKTGSQKAKHFITYYSILYTSQVNLFRNLLGLSELQVNAERMYKNAIIHCSVLLFSIYAWSRSKMHF